MKVMRLSASSALIVTALVGCGTQKQQPDQAAARKPESQALVSKTIEADPAHDAALEAEFSKMPTSVILRVRKDATGKEIEGSAEMVGLSAKVKEDKIEESFKAGSLLGETKNADNLDGDSSAGSWYGGNNYNSNDYNNQTTINYSNVNNGTQYGSANMGTGTAGGGQYGGNGNGYGYGSGYGNSNGYGYGSGVGQYSNGWNNDGSSYYNSYRPMYGSQVYQGAYWQYNRPSCYNYGNYNYYWYSRPSCSGWNSCGNQF